MTREAITPTTVFKCYDLTVILKDVENEFLSKIMWFILESSENDDHANKPS